MPKGGAVMAEHNIVLTEKGFKVITNVYKLDIGILVMLLAFLITFSILNPIFIPYYLIFFFIASVPYFYQKINKGYIYYVAYYYQLTIALLLVPPIFIRWQIMILVFFVFFPLYLKKDPIKQLRFSLGLFLGILFISFGLLLKKIGILNINFLLDNISSLMIPNNSLSAGLLFQQATLLGIPIANSSFSVFENFGVLIVIIPLTVIVCGDKIVKNFLIFVFIFLILSLNYHADYTAHWKKILNYTSIWFILYSAPGKNFHLNYNITLISLALTGISLMLILNYTINGLPTLILLNIYYLFYMISFRLYKENILENMMNFRKLRT